MIERTITINKIMRDSHGNLRNEDGKRFDSEEFSRFKYGSGKETQKFSKVLAERIKRERFKALRYFISSANYKHIPSAAANLTHAVFEILNNPSSTTGNLSLELTKIHREDVFEGDYSSLSKVEREKMMQNTRLAVPTYLKGRNLIVIDDVRASGAHERRLRKALKEAGVKETIYVYLLLTEKGVDGIEDILNQAAVKNLDDLKKIMSEDDYIITSRAVKFILSQKNLSYIETFLNQLPRNLMEKIVNGIKANEFDKMPLYEAQARLISEVAKKS